MIPNAHKFWQFIAKKLQSERLVTLLLVTASSGSSPGRVGFKMAVDDTGDRYGSIGGGIMEIKLAELAKKRLREREYTPLVKRQVHNKSSAKDQSGMICSGEQTVVFFTLRPAEISAVRSVLRALKSKRPAYLSLSPDGLKIQAGILARPTWEHTDLVDTDHFRYCESLGFTHQVCIIGGGHCALALSEVLARLDFHVNLYDDRPGLDTFDKNRFAQRKYLLDDYSRVGDLAPSGPNVYVVVMTLGYRTDEIVIRALLEREFAYFGVLGSVAKMTELLGQLRQEGISAEKLARIDTPAGLPIHSHTPAEIAISIAAQIIRVKNSAP